MTDILAELFAKRPAAPPASTARQETGRPEPVPDQLALDDAYGMTAITEMADQMRSCSEGGRDTLLNTLCVKAGGLIRDGHLRRDTAERYLRAAALEVADPSFTPWQIDEKLERVIDEGIESDYERTPRERDPFDMPATTADAPAAPAGPTLHEQMVAKELAVLRAREEARRLLTAERAALEFREPPSVPTLTEELQRPDEPVRYAVAGLLPEGGNALLTAQYKTGKTTTVNDLIRAFADSEPFLGHFEVTPRQGRIAVFNYELSEQQYRAWLREVGIVNTDAVSVLHLRGYRLPLTAAKIEDWVVGWLADRDVRIWIADPLARAAVGVDEDSNTEMGVWLDTLDVIKERAGVSELVLPNHTGRMQQEEGAERGRGATRVDDWADVRWILTRDDEGNRFFRATGRDVEVPEQKLTYDPSTRRLRIGGGDRAWVKNRALQEAVLAFVATNPGCSAGDIEQGVTGENKRIGSARKALVASHEVREEKAPKGFRYYLPGVFSPSSPSSPS